MKPREYCCCAIPLVNTGIYATLTEQLVLGVIVGTLSIATPSIVGAVTPVVAPWILAIIAYVGAGIQVLGLLGVARESAIAFRRYLTLHILATLAAFSVAALWIIMSAVRHSTAQSHCESRFFPGTAGSPTSSEGQILCNIFPWVTVGLMIALWLFLVISQFYFYLVLSAYSAAQQRDHANYGSEYDPTKPLAEDIPLADRASRAISDDIHVDAHGGYGHLKQESTDSTASGYRRPTDTYEPEADDLLRHPFPDQHVNPYTQEVVQMSNSRYTDDVEESPPETPEKPKPSHARPGEW